MESTHLIIIGLFIVIIIIIAYNFVHVDTKQTNESRTTKSKRKDELSFLNDNYEKKKLRELNYLLKDEDDDDIQSSDLF